MWWTVEKNVATALVSAAPVEVDSNTTGALTANTTATPAMRALAQINAPRTKNDVLVERRRMSEPVALDATHTHLFADAHRTAAGVDIPAKRWRIRRVETDTAGAETGVVGTRVA